MGRLRRFIEHTIYARLLESVNVRPGGSAILTPSVADEHKLEETADIASAQNRFTVFSRGMSGFLYTKIKELCF